MSKHFKTKCLLPSDGEKYEKEKIQQTWIKDAKRRPWKNQEARYGKHKMNMRSEIKDK